MSGTLLRSGNLREFHALGAVGNPVYLSASQLRSALRRRLGAEIADVLAIPQRNEDGDTIDWYAPRPGPVVPWSAASTDERSRAKTELLQARERIRATGEAMRAEQDSERRIFGQLLDLVTTFPNDGHVYLVDGRPVITFWGFQENNAPPGNDPLLLLPAVDPPPPPPEDKPVAKPRRRFPWWWLLLLLLLLLALLYLTMCHKEEPPIDPTGRDPVTEPSEPMTPEDARTLIDQPEQPVADPEREPPAVIQRVPGDDVDVVTGAGGVDGVTQGEDAGEVLPQDTVEGADPELTEEDAIGATTEEDAVEESAEDFPDEEVTESPPEETVPEEDIPPEDTPPEDVPPEDVPPEDVPPEDVPPEDVPPEDVPPEDVPPEDVPPEDVPPEDVPTEETPPETSATQPPAADRVPSASGQPEESPPGLEIPPGALESGSTEFLDGRWNSSTTLMDSDTGRPIELEYAFQDGAGTVTLKRDGVTCTAKTAAAVEDGRLVIKDSGDITCPDGTRYRGSRVECRVDEQGKADCSGSYPTGDTFSTKIRKSE